MGRGSKSAGSRMTPKAAARIQSAGDRSLGSPTGKSRFASRAQRAVVKNTGDGKR